MDALQPAADPVPTMPSYDVCPPARAHTTHTHTDAADVAEPHVRQGKCDVGFVL